MCSFLLFFVVSLEFVFFFKQKTAYEMRISDWSSDVCSSDLEATAHIDMVHLGIEIASSPLPTINDLGPTVTISDFGNNNGLVIGPAIADWRGADIADWPVSLLINGRERSEEHTSELQSLMRI